MERLASLLQQAQRAGIAPVEEIRAAMIAWRNEALSEMPGTADAVVLLSHVIWWLSQIKD